MLLFHGVRYEIDEDSDCWICDSHKTNKGGYLFINRIFQKEYLHRLMYSEKVKPILRGEHIKHTCHKKTCINPAHLYASKNKG